MGNILTIGQIADSAGKSVIVRGQINNGAEFLTPNQSISVDIVSVNNSENSANSKNNNNGNEIADYENALNQFKAAKYTTAITAFNNFIKNYSQSSLVANAYYWLGNAYYAQGNCKSAISTQRVITQKFASHSKAADAWLAIAACQQELGDDVSAKKSYQTIISKYCSNMFFYDNCRGI